MSIGVSFAGLKKLEGKKMIEYDNSSLTMDIYCDGEGCDEVVTYYGSWSDCIAQAKEDGWVSYKNENNEWEHKCPECKVKRVDELFRD